MLSSNSSKKTLPRRLPPEVLQNISNTDQKMGTLIKAVGRFNLRDAVATEVFPSLAESIVYQQLNSRAAETIFRRLLHACSCVSVPISPERVLGCSPAVLRSAGLSAAKAAALLDLATKSYAGHIPSIEQMKQLDNDQIVEALSTVRGIGVWTAQMFLIFRLRRADVLPESDLSIRKAIMATYDLSTLPSKDQLVAIGEKWKPWRTVATWYLYRALDDKILNN